MAYPRRLLAQGEEVDLELHNHWKVLVRPVLVLLVVIFLAAFGAAKIPSGSAQGDLRIAIVVLALILVIAFSLIPFLRWWTTIYVLTDRRLILREGIVARKGRDIPLVRVNDVSFSHTAFERLLRSGTLEVESAGERGQLILTDIPHVESVQRRLFELVQEASDGEDDRSRDRDRAWDRERDQDRDRGSAGGEPEAPARA